MWYYLPLPGGKWVARAIAWVLVLSLFWAGLSGYLKPLLVGSGVLSIAFSWWFVRRAKVELVDWSVPRMVLACVTYLPWLLWQVVLSNIRVTMIVWSPKLPIAPQVVEVPCSLTTPTGVTLFANSITMTPGTVTLSVGETLLVHALTAKDAAGVLDGSMEARIRKLEPGATPAPALAPAPEATAVSAPPAEPNPSSQAAPAEAGAAPAEAALSETPAETTPSEAAPSETAPTEEPPPPTTGGAT